MPHWNTPELARLHRDLEMAYRHLPESDDDKAYKLRSLMEQLEDWDHDYGELEFARPAHFTLGAV